MCKRFTAIEMINRNTGETVASVEGTMYFGKILPYTRINFEGNTTISGLGKIWFVPTHYILVSTKESIQREIDRMKSMYPNTEIRVTEQGKRFIYELKIKNI